MKKKIITSSVLVALILLISCSGGTDFTPKPKGFNHIEIPTPSYSKFTDSAYPYQFDVSKYAEIYDDTTGIVGDGWKIIDYKALNAQIYVTYEPIKSQKDGYDLISDSYKIAYKHDVKAYAIERKLIHTTKGYPVVIFELEGEVPSPYQFFTHNIDTTQYFRGAVYFPFANKNDSLAPLIDYLVNDMNHLIESFEWN